MKKMMEMIQKKKKSNNEGFSLVELIIVISIMAILMGVVGTQVLPYLNKSKESNDSAVLGKIHTAAVSSFAFNADVVGSSNDYKITSTLGDKSKDVCDPPCPQVVDEMRTLIGITTDTSFASYFKSKATSPKGDTVQSIEIKYDKDTGLITLQAYNVATPASGGAIFNEIQSK